MKNKEKFIELFNLSFGEDRKKEIIEKCQIEHKSEFYIDVFKLKNLLNYNGDMTKFLFEVPGDDNTPYFLMDVIKNPDTIDKNMIINSDGVVSYEDNK
jgi:hypothetical protein